MVISCDLSPSSATNTTERLTSAAVSMGTTFRHVADRPIAHDPSDFGRRSRPPLCGSPAGLALLVLLACALPVCRLDDWGLLPFVTSSTIAAMARSCHLATQVRVPESSIPVNESNRSKTLMRQAAWPG